MRSARATLAERGYHHFNDRVDEPGEFAIRGQTIDAFPAGQPRLVCLSVEPADGSNGTPPTSRSKTASPPAAKPVAPGREAGATCRGRPGFA